MSSVRITIATDNAAFEGDGSSEVARILRKAADNLESEGELLTPGEMPLRDYNGHIVGELKVFDRKSGNPCHNPPLRIRPKRAYRHANYPESTALDPTVVYDAVHATNQPDWKKQGKIFVESPGNAPELLLEKGDYEIVSQNPYDPRSLPLDELEDWVNNDEGLYAWWKSTRLSMRKFISENRDDLRGAIREVLDREPSRNPGRTLQVGTRVEVSAGSGTNSGRRGTVVPRSRIKTCGRGIPLLPGHYKPMSKDEVVVELDDGSLITMYKNRLGAL